MDLFSRNMFLTPKPAYLWYFERYFIFWVCKSCIKSPSSVKPWPKMGFFPTSDIKPNRLLSPKWSGPEVGLLTDVYCINELSFFSVVSSVSERTAATTETSTTACSGSISTNDLYVVNLPYWSQNNYSNFCGWRRNLCNWIMDFCELNK